MRKYLLLLIIFILPASLKAERYQIELMDYNSYFEVWIKSTKNFGFPRYLKPLELYIGSPEDENGPGLISMTIEQDANVESLDEPGQDQGCIEFRKGICLPKINIGEYQLIIDEEYYGIIYVTRNKTFFTRFYEVNYDMYK